MLHHIGMKQSRRRPTGAAAWTYDAAGRATKEKRTLNSVTRETTYAYNLGGLLTSVTYPSGQTVSYTYGNAARATEAKDNGLSRNYALSALYAPQGALSNALHSQDHGFGGITYTASYNNRLQPTALQATSANGTVLNLAYGYGTSNNGNVAAITNNIVNNRTQSFTYDKLNRILTAESQATSGSDCWGQNFYYDATYYTNLQSITSRKCSTQALTLSISSQNRITNSGFSYDAAGNTTQDGTGMGTYQYTWNAESQQRSETPNGGGSTVNYTYDGDGRRVKKDNGTLYWYSVAGEVLAESALNGNLTREFIYFGGRRLARREASGAFYYFFADHLGTAKVMTNDTGVTQQESTYYPFGGEQRQITNTVDNRYKFTGKERDAETGNDYFIARYYPNNLARFLSPDPLMNSGRPWAPQTWNRYAYTQNNPLRSIDPNGLYDYGATCALGSGGDLCRQNQQRWDNAVAKAKQLIQTLMLKKDSKVYADQYAELKKALDAIGSRGDKNGVIVNFGETATGGPMETIGKQITVNWKRFDEGVALYRAARYETDTGVEAAAEAGHEGIHLTRTVHRSEPNSEAIFLSVEREAYGVQSSVSEAGGSESVVWNNSWAKSADRETLRQNAVKEAARESLDASREAEGRSKP